MGCYYMIYKQSKGELFAKNSSLAVRIEKDLSHQFEIIVFERRSYRIVNYTKIPMNTISFLNLKPIVKPHYVLKKDRKKGRCIHNRSLKDYCEVCSKHDK